MSIVVLKLPAVKRTTEEGSHKCPYCEGETFQRWVGKTLKELQETIPKEWLWVLEEIRQLLDLLPLDGSKQLHAL
jgi:hypothetical protein